MSDEEDRELARRALLGDLESIQHLLGMKNAARSEDGEVQHGIPVLRDVVATALEARGQSLEELLPESAIQADEEAIPVLTDRADGERLNSGDEQALAATDPEIARLVDLVLADVIPELESSLRESLVRSLARHLRGDAEQQEN